MKKFIFHRLSSGIVTLFLVSILVSLLIQLLPGNAAVVIAGPYGTRKEVSFIAKELHLNQPWPDRYIHYLWSALHGNLGESLVVRPGISVWQAIWQAAPVTLSLTGITLVLVVLASLAFGCLAALRRDTVVDRMVTSTASVAMSVPAFVIGLVLISFFAVDHQWFPLIGYVSPSAGIWPWLHHLILPSLTLGAIATALLARQARGSMIDALEQDYVRTARAMGLSRWKVFWKHSFKNALTPILTIAGLQVAGLLGGAIVVEQVFTLNGIGTLAFESVDERDIPVVQGLVLVIAVVVISINILVDIVNAYVNPRERPQ